MRDSGELMSLFRAELRRAVQQRFTRVDLDRFKQEMREFVTHFLFDQTGRSPIVIPVVNVIGGKGEAKTGHTSNQPSVESKAEADQKRFQVMRARLLSQS